MHWADKYVGIPFKDHGHDLRGFNCWGLVRFVWAKEIGFEMPSFDRSKDVEGTIERESQCLIDADRWNLKEFDAVVMLEQVEVKSGWMLAPVHIGIMATPNWILHVRRNQLSCIEPLKMMHVHSCKRAQRA